ncbi:MAG TPA: hypothetical protein VJN96_23995 [Vicinamibacterales bacterium]|nr:hypothetical protein [Vicinamibacterales bacterium]
MLRKTTPGVIFIFFAAIAWLIAPVSLGDARVAIPPGTDLDAVGECLIVADGMDKLLTRPAAYYDTAILYPDHHQLRTTEPFLGFALLGLPLRTIARLGDVDVFEALRWLLVFASLTYAWLFFRALGAGTALSLAGAVLCWSQPPLFNGTERLQVLSIPLIFAVAYHGLIVWTSDRRRPAHQVGLFAAAALYPLCGVINATICVLATLLVLPSIARAIGHASPRRLASIAVPLAAAATLDVLALAPWLFDRWDLRVYVTNEFLAVKHWYPTMLPGTIADDPAFVAAYVGIALVPAVLFIAAVEKYLWPLLGSAVVVVAAVMAHTAGSLIGTLQLIFQVTCWTTLFVFFGRQLYWPGSADETSLLRRAATTAAGVGVFLCLMSFGPVYVSNDHPLASTVMRVLLVVLPPLKAIREFDRLWTFGLLALGTSATFQLALLLRARRPALRMAIAALLVAVAAGPIFMRPLVASAAIEAPRALVDAASRSHGTGGIYVHPMTDWNTMPAALMMPVAKALRRPIVNGYLGIEPPWFQYAANVLRRFPDPEALWLLQTWHVDTVVNREDLSVTDLPPRERIAHPSLGVVPDHADRVEVPWARGDGSDRVVLTAATPPGFQASAVEMHFAPSAVDPIPSEVIVYTGEGGVRARANDGESGRWLESLSADALVRRQLPVATVRLARPVAGELQLDLGVSRMPPLQRLILVGLQGR